MRPLRERLPICTRNPATPLIFSAPRRAPSRLKSSQMFSASLRVLRGQKDVLNAPSRPFADESS